MDYVIGGGVTGLAAGIASGATVLEAHKTVGGHARCFRRDGYVAGYSGHWLFGYSEATKRWVKSLVDVVEVKRDARVLIDGKVYHAPIQGHVDEFGELAPRIYAELAVRSPVEPRSFREWLRINYGDTLFKLFFDPFNGKYLCGYHDIIEPLSNRNDSSQLESLLRGKSPSGYNAEFMAVRDGIDCLTDKMSEQCDIIRDCKVTSINLGSHTIQTSWGEMEYSRLICAIPLIDVSYMAGFSPWLPYLTTLCINVGTDRVGFEGHWMYLAGSETAYRIGNYTEVDETLAPTGKHLIYMDCNVVPHDKGLNRVVKACIKEAQDAGLIGNAEYVRVLTANPGYALRGIGDSAKIACLTKTLADHDVFLAGGYANWMYQGMAKDMEDGFRVGSTVRAM